MFQYLLTGILIGLCFGVPVGAVGAMTAQRTLNYNRRAGLLTGLGASVADCLYASVGAFSLTFLSDFLLKHQMGIHLFGGILVAIMGIGTLVKKETEAKKERKKAGSVQMFLSSFAVGITNPAAILTFLFAFSWFGIEGGTSLISGIGLVFGVFIGTFIWWWLLSWTVAWLKRRAKMEYLHRINKVFGAALLIFGIAILVGSFSS